MIKLGGLVAHIIREFDADPDADVQRFRALVSGSSTLLAVMIAMVALLVGCSGTGGLPSGGPDQPGAPTDQPGAPTDQPGAPQIPQSNLPSAPTQFRHECINPICRTIRFKWSPPISGLPLLRYESYILGLWSSVDGADLTGDVEFLLFAAQHVNGTFTYRVRAVNEYGPGPAASLTLTIPPESVQDKVAPTAVIGLTTGICLSQACSKVPLHWSPPNTGLPITDYEVWASNHPDWRSVDTDEFGNPYNRFTYTDDTWDEGEYTYKVRAVNPHGTGPEASVTLYRRRQ